MKQLPALIAALLVTTVLGLGIFVIGVNAMSNQNRAQVLNSPSQAATVTTTTAGVSQSDQAQIQQLQNLISQYQSREKQYQDQLNTLNQQVNQSNAQLQQYQSLLAALQQRGLIRVQSDGTILIPRGFSGGDDNNSFTGN